MDEHPSYSKIIYSGRYIEDKADVDIAFDLTELDGKLYVHLTHRESFSDVEYSEISQKIKDHYEKTRNKD
jgi:hypothetical protein